MRLNNFQHPQPSEKAIGMRDLLQVSCYVKKTPNLNEGALSTFRNRWNELANYFVTYFLTFYLYFLTDNLFGF